MRGVLIMGLGIVAALCGCAPKYPVWPNAPRPAIEITVVDAGTLRPIGGVVARLDGQVCHAESAIVYCETARRTGVGTLTLHASGYGDRRVWMDRHERRWLIALEREQHEAQPR